jgi:predicted RNA binding protein YcfA (HicA-like mRNA interferase family)
MAALPTVTASEAMRAFEKAGFRVVRTTGSHHIMKKPGHRNNLSIPKHGSANMKPGLHRAQIRAAGLTVEEFVNLL